MKTFALIAHTDRGLIWFASGSFDDMQGAMTAAIATHDEEDRFMILREYAGSWGGLRDGKPV